MENIISNIKLQQDENVIFNWWNDLISIGSVVWEIPCLALLTNRRIIFVSEYTTQHIARVAILIPIPLGKKKEHTFYADFSLSYIENVKVKLMGGCVIIIKTHGELEKQFPRNSGFFIKLTGLKKSGYESLRDEINKLKGRAIYCEEFGKIISY